MTPRPVMPMTGMPYQTGMSMPSALPAAPLSQPLGVKVSSCLLSVTVAG
jgi:hypothetical protein